MLKRRLGIALLVAGIALLVVSLARGDGFGRFVFHTYNRSGMVMRGRIFDGYGNPAPGQPVQVVVQPFAGGPPAVYGGVTDGTGRYTVVVPHGPSRLITVTAAGSTQETREIVAPYLWISVRSLRHGNVRFSGGVAIAHGWPLPTVILQDRTSSGWRTFGAVNPNPRSHFWRFIYQHAAPQTLAFRVVTLATAAWAPGRSRVKEATIG